MPLGIGFSVKVRISVAEVDYLAGWSTRREQDEESPEADVPIFCSRVGASLIETHKHRIPCEGNPQLRNRAGNCSIRDESSGRQLPN